MYQILYHLHGAGSDNSSDFSSISSVGFLLYMLMRKKMILTIFIISITLGAEPELKVRIIQFCPSTYCTTVDNPYALELTVRAGTSRKFAEAEPDEKYAILVQAAQKFGIRLF